MTPTEKEYSPEWAQRAAELVRRYPLRWHDGASERPRDEVLSSGWFLGASECAAALCGASSPAIVSARAFGGEWPLLSDEGWMTAPAVPVAIAATPIDGVDAEYELRPEGVWREAGGISRLFIASEDSPPEYDEPFDLLWFGTNERYVVRRGELVIEDLFGRLYLAALPALLERLLVRARRLPHELIAGLPTTPNPRMAGVEIERPVDLIGESLWRDPERFLSCRADISAVKRSGSTIEVESAHDGPVQFELDEGDDRWRVRVSQGKYPLTDVSLGLSQNALKLQASIDDRIDPLAPGMRGRLVFDLHADMVALGSS